MKEDISYVDLTWKQIEFQCGDIFQKVQDDDFEPEVIVALLRGGVVPGRILSDYFHILLDFFTLDVKFYTGVGKTLEQPSVGEFYWDINGKNALIVDDIWDSGKTMKAVLDKLGYKTNIRTATLFWKETAPEKPNYYSEIASKNEWIIFPFEKQEFKRLMKKNKKTNF